MAEPCPECGSTLGPEHLCPAVSQRMIGKVLENRYEIDSILGQGGMGTVFLGFQTSVRRPVAIKTLHATLAAAPQFFERFRREAEIASKLRHPNIITIYDFGRIEDGTCYYVMELLTGESLKELVKREGPLSIAKAMNLIEQAARGLGYAHRENVVHRDIKPHNIMVQNLDGSDFVKVLDFGLVKAMEQDENDQLTSTGQVLGTPQYMPPEQAGGESVDQRSDLYSLAGVLYYCLTGSSPFGANTVRKALRAALTETVPPVNTKRIGSPVPKELDEFFRKGLAAEKDERFQNTEEFIQEMKLATAGLSESELNARPVMGDASNKDAASGDHSARNAETVEGKAKGAERTPSGARPTRPESPAVIVDPRLTAARGNTPVMTRARPNPRRPVIAGVLAGALLLGLAVAYGARWASARAPVEPPKPLLVVEPPKPQPPAEPPKASNEVAVRLRSTPDGADVYEGAVQIGTTPVDLRLARDKIHPLTFKRAGYEPSERSLDLSRLGQDATQLDVVLQPTAKPVQSAGGRKKKAPDIPVFE